MCGRMAITDPDRVVRRFSPDDIRTPIEKPRYNLAPSQMVPAMIEKDGQRILGELKWGLVPPWAKEVSIGNRMINARAETVHEKPAYRAAYKRRRCIIPADGFYEWKRSEDGRQPYFIGMKEREPFAIAGLYEIWSGGGERLATCTLITTTPNALMAPIHDRMPVILEEKDWGTWLAPGDEDAEARQDLLKPCAPDTMHAFPVSTHVNSPAHDDPDCIREL